MKNFMLGVLAGVFISFVFSTYWISVKGYMPIPDAESSSYTLEQIQNVLGYDIATEDMLEDIESKCIAFEMTRSVEFRLLDRGADDDLIQGLMRLRC